MPPSISADSPTSARSTTAASSSAPRSATSTRSDAATDTPLSRTIAAPRPIDQMLRDDLTPGARASTRNSAMPARSVGAPLRSRAHDQTGRRRARRTRSPSRRRDEIRRRPSPLASRRARADGARAARDVRAPAPARPPRPAAEAPPACASEPPSKQRIRAEKHGTRERLRRENGAELLEHHREIRVAESEAAVLLGKHDARPAERRPSASRARASSRSDRRRRAGGECARPASGARTKSAAVRLQQLLLLGEIRSALTTSSSRRVSGAA